MSSSVEKPCRKDSNQAPKVSFKERDGGGVEKMNDTPKEPHMSTDQSKDR